MALDLGSMESYSIQQEINKRRDRAKRQAGTGVDMESALGVPITSGITPPVGGTDGAPPDGAPPARDPEILYDQWNQPNWLKDPDGKWVQNPKYGINPDSSGKDDDDTAVEADPGAAKYLEWLKDNNALSAKAVIEGYLGAFELDGLATWVQENIKLGYNAEVMLMQLRYGDSKADEFLGDGRRNPMYIKQEYRNIYDDRFPGMAMRREKKMTPITEADYIDLERGYTQISNAAKIGSTFLTVSTDTYASGITRLIGGDVSLAEFRTRVALAEEAANNADPEVIKILRDNYNFTGGDIVSSFLDPEGTKSVVEMRRNLGAAGLMFESGQALGTGKRFSTDLSDKLYDMDVQRREIAAVMSPLAGLTGGTLTDAALTSTQLGQGAFGTNQASTVALRRQREKRSTRFQGRSGMLTSTEGIAFGGTST